MIYILVKIIGWLQLAIVIRAIMTWFPYNHNMKVVYDFLDAITNPIMDFVYKITDGRTNFNGADFSPMIAYFGLHLIKIVLYRFRFF